MKGSKLTIGIIGCGGIAMAKHLPALARLPDLCQVTAFCDPVVEKAEKAVAQYGAGRAKVYTDHRELLKDGSIDAVHVLTPNVFHAPITVDALEAGKHVMCEKPMAHSYADAKRMMDAATRTRKKLTIAYQNRFRQDAQTLKRACRDGALGEIYFAKAHAVRRRAVPTWGVFPNKALQGGGPLIDIGTHALDLTLWMMENYSPKTVTGQVFHKMADQYEGNLFGPWDPKTMEVEDSAFGFIKMANGAVIFLEASWVLNTTDEKEAALTLCGTKAGAEVNGGMGRSYQLTLNGSRHGRLFDEKMVAAGGVAYFAGESAEPGDVEAKQWVQSILEDAEPLVKPEQALVVTRILEAVYRSAESGKTIEL